MAETEVAEPEAEEVEVDAPVEDEEAKFTQRQFSDGMTAAKAKAERAAAKKVKADLEADLGMTVAEAKKFREERDKADAYQLTEIERKEKELDEKLRVAEELASVNLRERLKMKAEQALRDAGVASTRAAVRLIPSLNLATDADDEAIAEAVEQLREDMPEVFTAVDDETESESPGRSGTPGRSKTPPKNPVPVLDSFERGKARAEKLKADKPQRPLERFQGRT